MPQEILSLSTERVPVVLVKAWKRVSSASSAYIRNNRPLKIHPGRHSLAEWHLTGETACIAFLCNPAPLLRENQPLSDKMLRNNFIMYTDVNLEAVLATATADSVQQQQAKKSLKTPDSEKNYCNSYTAWPKFKHDSFLLRPKTNSCLTGMDPGEEALSLLNKIWEKLQGLPDATPVELGAFFILLTFICEF